MAVNFLKSIRSTHGTPVPTNTNVDHIRAGDFNGDGKLDIIISEINNDLGTTPSPFIFMTGDGTSALKDVSKTIFNNGIQYGNFVSRSEVGDINGDGIDDIFAVDNGIDKQPFTGGYNELFLSNGAGGLTNASAKLPALKINSHGASLGDVNNDGRVDILVNALMFDGTHLWLQTPNGNFIDTPEALPILKTPATYDKTQIVPQTSTYSGLIDLNLDGYLDMILGTWSGTTKPSEIYFNQQGKFNASLPTTLPSTGIIGESILDVEQIDLNGDSLPDLLLSITNDSITGGPRYNVNYIQLLVNKGNGVFEDQTAPRIDTRMGNLRDGWYKYVDVVDMNKDGAMDLVGHGFGSPDLFMNDGSGHFTLTSTGAPPYTNSVTGDFDNDGLPDIAMAINNAFVDVWKNTSENLHIYKANFGGETLLGSTGNDTFIQRNGQSKFIGNGGVDTAQLSLTKAAYTLKIGAGMTTVAENTLVQNNVELQGISRIKFADTAVATDLEANAGSVAKVLGAVFGKYVVENRGYVGIGLGLADAGVSYKDLAGLALAVKGSVTNDQVVTTLWTNVIGYVPSAGEKAPYLELLNSGMSVADLTVLAAETSFNSANINLVGLSKTGIEYLPA